MATNEVTRRASIVGRVIAVAAFVIGSLAIFFFDFAVAVDAEKHVKVNFLGHTDVFLALVAFLAVSIPALNQKRMSRKFVWGISAVIVWVGATLSVLPGPEALFFGLLWGTIGFVVLAIGLTIVWVVDGKAQATAVSGPASG